MNIILWLVVIPSVASVLIYFLIEFIRLARRGYRIAQEPLPEELETVEEEPRDPGGATD